MDTYTLAGREGDVFLICSDGLTSMISDEEVGSILRSAGSLDEAADALVRAANQSGGKDNITVILFRLGDGEAEDGREPAESQDTIVGLTVQDVEDARAEQQPAAALGDAPADATVIRPPVERGPAERARPRRRRRLPLAAAATVLLLVGVLGGLYLLSRQVYFIGTNDAGLVTVYKGLPYELPLGIDLYEEDYASGMPARAIPERRRARVLDHEWRGRDDAVDLVRALERGQLDAGAPD